MEWGVGLAIFLGVSRSAEHQGAMGLLGFCCGFLWIVVMVVCFGWGGGGERMK